MTLMGTDSLCFLLSLHASPAPSSALAAAKTCIFYAYPAVQTRSRSVFHKMVLTHGYSDPSCGWKLVNRRHSSHYD